MSVSVKQFQTNAVQFTDDVKYSDGRIHHAWLVPLQFSTLRLINAPWYLNGDRTPLIPQEMQTNRQANVKFVQKLILESISDLKTWGIM